MILFGSRARSTADDDADFDVLVVEPVVDNMIEESVRLRSQLDDLDVPIDVIAIDEAKARQRALERGTMVERALREGRLIAQT